jgi:hypothetical protein
MLIACRRPNTDIHQGRAARVGILNILQHGATGSTIPSINAIVDIVRSDPVSAQKDLVVPRTLYLTEAVR